MSKFIIRRAKAEDGAAVSRMRSENAASVGTSYSNVMVVSVMYGA